MCVLKLSLDVLVATPKENLPYLKKLGCVDEPRKDR